MLHVRALDYKYDTAITFTTPYYPHSYMYKFRPFCLIFRETDTLLLLLYTKHHCTGFTATKRGESGVVHSARV
jgi:hypothetical protein